MATGHVFHFHAGESGEIEDRGVEQRDHLGHRDATGPGARVGLEFVEDAPSVGGEPVAQGKRDVAQTALQFAHSAETTGAVDELENLALDGDQGVFFAKFDREKIERTVLDFDQIVAHRKKLWRLPLSERKEITGLPKLRADVILTGVLIYEMVMEEFGFKQLRISTRGLRFAAVME